MRHISAFSRASQAVSLISYYTALLELETLPLQAQSLLRMKLSQWRSLLPT